MLQCKYTRGILDYLLMSSCCAYLFDKMTDFSSEFPPNFNYVKVDNGCRANLLSESDVGSWIKLYSEKTMTNWRVKFRKSNPSRYVCRKVFACHHSGLRRVDPDENKRGKSKNTYCKAEIDILVKLTTENTKKKDKFIKDGFPAVIIMNHAHNHEVETAAALSCLKPSDETRSAFEAYFNNGCGIREAMDFHESKLELDFSDSGKEMANALLNPVYRTVQTWYTRWTEDNLGPRSGNGVIEKLMEKQEHYKQNGVSVEIQEDPFAVVVVTPLMQRAHCLPFAKDIVFADTTSSCDAECHSVTFLLAPSGVGAIPLAVIITKGQDADDYTAGFEVFKSAFPVAFAGNKHPKLFLTDDSKAERLGLNKVWPDATCLLCRFHVSQAVWRWLFNKDHGIDKDHRRILYSLFQNILTAKTPEDAEKAYFNAVGDAVMGVESSIVKMYPNWISYVSDYYDRKEIWCLAWRDETTHGHQTNNFSEVNVRLFKDIVLHRHKAYNAVSLVDIICSSMEQYFVRRLRKFVNGRNDAPRLFLDEQLRKASYILKTDIEEIEPNLYHVKSEKENELYKVDVFAGFCSCSYGREGRFCKHQAAIYKNFNKNFSNAPPVDTSARFEIAKLAFGNNAQPAEFYNPNLLMRVTEMETENNTVSAHSSLDLDINTNTDLNLNKADDGADSPQDLDLLNENVQEAFRKNLNNFKASPAILKLFLQRLRKVKSNIGWDTFLCTAGSQIPRRHHRHANIHVQTTSISRRRPGVTKGRKRLPVGRPFKGEKKIKKRKRNLALNVKLNVANAKSHGSGH